MSDKFRSAGMVFLIISGLLLFSGCQSFQTSYFGVEDEAIYAPKDFSQTRKTIESAKETTKSLYAERKIDESMELGTLASVTYWKCYNQEAKNVLALARQSVYRAELFHPQPLPPTPKRTSDDPLTPESPESLDADPPFAGLKALPPRMILCSVNFDFNSAQLLNDSKRILDSQIPTLKRHSDFVFEIVGYSDFNFEIAGHTDNKGSDSYNQRLSNKRAKSVLNYLAAKGISNVELSPVGYGEASPVALNQTKEGQDKNRRSEIRVIGSLLPEIALKDLGSLPAGTTIEVINFNYGEDRLLPIYRSLLDKSIPLIKENPTAKFEVAGFADSSGGAESNVSLSLKRANNVKKYLVSKGVPKDRLTTTVYATLQPIVTNETSIGRGFNRRVEIKTME